MIMPSLKEWFEGTFGANIQHKSVASVSAVPSHVVLVVDLSPPHTPMPFLYILIYIHIYI